MRAYELRKKRPCYMALGLFLCFRRGFILSGKCLLSFQTIFLRAHWLSDKWAALTNRVLCTVTDLFCSSVLL